MRAVALWAVLAALAALVVVRRLLLRRRGIPASLARLARAIPDALGDAVVVVDLAGKIAFVNPAAAHLSGRAIGELLDHDVAELAPELAALARGLDRGPACARIAVSGAGGPVKVRAALVRITARPPLALAVLRTLPRRAQQPPPVRRAAAPPEQAQAIPGLAVAVTAVQDPMTRAAQAISILRLAAPQLPARAEAALAAAEAALETAVHRVGALAVAGHGGGARRAIDLAALVEDLVATFPPPPGVRLRFELAAARALADDRPVRAAVRELLAAAAAGLPAGGEIEVAVRSAGASALVELRTGGDLAPGGLALARALVAGQGGRVEEEAVPGRGSLARLALERAAALEPA